MGLKVAALHNSRGLLASIPLCTWGIVGAACTPAQLFLSLVYPHCEAVMKGMALFKASRPKVLGPAGLDFSGHMAEDLVSRPHQPPTVTSNWDRDVASELKGLRHQGIWNSAHWRGES